MKQSVDNAQADIYVLTCYDAYGRVAKTSNPVRSSAPPTCTSSLEWTTPAYDSAGRVSTVTSPDSAVVTTGYSLATSGSQIGTAVTVTDQAGKLRRSVTNALGQLSRVDEPDGTSTTGSLGNIDAPTQPTIYSYDTLNNLMTVLQASATTAQCGGASSCTQTRTFTYDSLSRLLTAANPESGTINYTYDNNNNLATKTDAKGVVTTYAYDTLNRVKTRIYTNEPSGQAATPNVTYFYDNVTNAKGKLIKVSSSVSTTEYTSFDILGRVTGHKQTTDGGDSAGYSTSYTYNLSGAMIEETYPSTRVVKNTLDANGELAEVDSKKTSTDFYRPYVNSFVYNAAGAVSSLKLGNGRFENTQFNSRLQPTQIGLGASASTQNLLKLNFDYGTTDNNGNVKSQTITVPTIGSNAGFVATQNYSYDSLNRIKQSTETIPSQTGWQQTFQYDRYGNRRFDTSTGATTTLAANCTTAVCNPTIDTATNRLVGYVFDNSGNTTTDAENRTFVYDAENRQTEVRDAQNIVVGQYRYDGDGRRIKKIVPNTGETTIFVYDAGSKLIAEYSTVVASSNDAKISYLTNDHLGSPRITTDSIGQVISRRDFMPFGEEITRANYGTDSVRQKFTSYERDIETDLDYAKARMFGSGFGRFTSPDDFLNDTFASDPKSWNLYVYVRNNPLRYIDPNGEIKKDCGKNKDEICFDEKEKNVTRNYGTNTVTYEGKDGKMLTIKAEFTGKVTVGTIYADDGTPITADKSEGALTVKLTDENGDVLYNGSLDELKNSPFTGQNNVANCHGVTFADAKFWINNDQVGALMIGDGYDVNRPSSTPTKGAAGIFSTDGTLGANSVKHSVTVVEPGTLGKNPTLVDSKGGRELRTTTTPENAWTNTDPGRKNHQLKYYPKKVKK